MSSDSTDSRPDQECEAPSAPSRSDLARLMALSGEPMCVLDAEWRMLAVNPRACAILGAPSADLVGQRFADSVDPHDRVRLRAILTEVGQHSGARHCTVRHQHKSGLMITVDWSVSASAGHWQLVGSRADTGPVGVRSPRVGSEVSDAAGHAKTEFLASMNHELRTPLNAILGYTELLSADADLSPRQGEALHAIKRGAQHLLLLISDILDFARLDANKLTLSSKEFLLSGFLDNLLELFESRALEKGIAFAFQATTPLPTAVCADETRLRQVLLNLLSNAVKFTEHGGVVLRASYRRGKLRFAVADTGIGIAPESLEAIFHPFEQIPGSNRFVEGTGLGLALCRRLVQLMGGTLHVESEVGLGSTFWFAIEPAEVARWPDKQVRHTVITGYEGPERCILVVDDQPQTRALLRGLLSAVAIRVAEAAHGHQAVERALADPPDLILMDLVMPELDGFEASRQIRARSELSGIPIIATSSATPLVERGIDLARLADDRPVYDGFLAKPVDLDALYDLIAEHLDLDWHYGSAHSGEWALPEIQPQDMTPPGATENADGSLHGERAGERARDRTVWADERARIQADEPDDHRGAQASGPRVALDGEQLQAIYNAATIGDIREILSILERAGHRADDAVGSDSLAAEIHQLARAFRSRHIKELLQPYLP